MKRRMLAWALSAAMVFSALPTAPLWAEETNAAAPEAAARVRTADTPEGFGENVALTATAGAAHTNVWGISTTAINDGVLADNDPTTSWNCYGADDALYPMPVTLTWEAEHKLKAMRVMWWGDSEAAEATGGVTFPTSAEVEYLDADGETWHKIAAVGVEHGGANGANGVWNTVEFDSEITTTSLRMHVQRSGSEDNGIGISEWQVFGSKITDRLQKAVIVGSESIAINTEKEYTAKVIPEEMAANAAYAWSVEPAEKAVIQGDANKAAVKVKALSAGKFTLKLNVTIGEGEDAVSKEAELEIHVEGVESIDTYKTTTAAGVAPILPDSVVANGLVFDEPTPSLKTANNNVDLGETFNSKLIPVQWNVTPLEPSMYASDQIGKTITVTGTAYNGEEEYEATAEIMVKSPAAAAESNRSVTFENVQLNDAFWAPKQETNALVSLDKAILEISKASGGEPNFDNAIKKLNGEAYDPFSGFVFQDSDIYKSIEAISYTLSATQNDTGEEIEAQREKLKATLNSWIEKIEKVQYADGYIDTFFTLRSTTYSGGESTGTHRWKNFSNHEMYNAGHFLEAVVAYTRYTEGIGEPDYRLYVAGKRFADEIVSLFGENGTRHEVPGHEEIELALVKFGKLAEEYEGEGAGDDYYKTAKIFIDRRGEVEYDEATDRVISNPRDSGYYGYTYSQDKTPFVEETNAKGHSVRAGYFYAGVTDVATTLDENDPDRAAYLNSLDAIWDSVTYKKTYITGGIGTTAPSSDSEGFGDDYVLPNDQSYCEICAAISMANWNQRMNLLYEDGKYADSVEKALYNAILVGTNLDGNRFYYSTLLEAKSGNWRSEWFACACCPPNLMRTLAALSGYMYTVHNNDLFVNMYVGSNGSANIGGSSVGLVQETNYPWDGSIKLTVNPEESKAFQVKVRIPGWVAEQTDKTVAIKVNGEAVTTTVEKGYATISRTWNKGDVVTIDIPMEIRKTEADPNVTTNDGRIALQRGPIVYSLEKAGNAQLNPEIEDFDPLKIVIPRDANLKANYNENLLKGVVEITGDAKYSMYGELLPVKIQAVPYYAWNNRGDDAEYTPGDVDKTSSKMLIWTMADKAISAATAGIADDAGPSAAISADYTYGGARIEGVHDPSFEPESSSLGDGFGWSNWAVSRDDTPHWLQYTWENEITTKQMQIYWYDNYWNRIPGSLKIQYQDADGQWQDAVMKQTYEEVVNIDRYNTIDIEEITTKAIRLVMTVNLEEEGTQSIGVYRWKVILDKESVAANVENMIRAIGIVEGTEASKKLIYDARMAYDSLADELKAMVSNVADLEAAEESYAEIVADVAKTVEALIAKIGTVTADSKNQIADARIAYETLTIFQKAAVSNYNDLVAAEDAYEALTGEKPAPDADRTDISAAKVDEISVQKFTGKALKPAVNVTYNGKTLEKDTDYIVGYKNNTNVGTAEITITGIGSYTGTLTADFTIEKDQTIDPVPIDISAAKVAAITAQKYTGKALTPVVNVTYNGKTLVKDTDYTVSYRDNTNVGTAKITITGKGNYTGTLTATFEIYKEQTIEPTMTDISTATIAAIAAQNYTGKALTPAVTVTCNGKTLVKDTDYTISYSSNINIGTAKVTLTGKGNYKGTLTTAFAITVKKNASYTVGNYKYKITNANTSGKGAVTLTGVKNNSIKTKLKKISVAASIKIGGKSFSVTAIGNNAFSGCKNATSAVIGKKVTKIGSKAFYNCKKLKKISVKATGLKSVGKNALKGIHANAKITVPKNKLKKYKSLLKSKGQKKSVKIQ